MKNLYISGKIVEILLSDFSDKEIGQIVRAAAEYAENDTLTDFKERGMRLAYELIAKSADARESNRERQARYRKKQKEGKT